MARDELSPAYVVLPGVDVADVRAEFSAMGLIGWVVDGPVLGHRDLVVGVLAGDERCAWVVDDEGLEQVAWSDVRARLVGRWPGTLVADEVHEQANPAVPIPLSRDQRHTAVAVAPREDLMLGVVAKTFGVSMHEASRADHVLVGMDVDPAADLVDDALDHAFGATRGVVVSLWRRGPVTGLAVLRKGRVREIHWWAPPWEPVGGDREVDDDIRAAMLPPEGDAAELGDLLGLDQAGVVNLRALLRRDEPDVGELVELLGLPSEVVDVLEGGSTVAGLPGGQVVGPSTVRAEMKRAMQPSEHDPGWMKALERGQRELRPWYVISTLVSVAVGAGLVLSAGGVSGVTGVLGVLLALGGLFDLTIRYGLKRGRQEDSE